MCNILQVLKFHKHTHGAAIAVSFLISYLYITHDIL